MVIRCLNSVVNVISVKEEAVLVREVKTITIILNISYDVKDYKKK